MGTDFNRELIIQLLKKGPEYRFLTKRARIDVLSELKMTEEELVKFIVKSLNEGVNLHCDTTRLEAHYGKKHWWFTNRTNENIEAYIKLQIDDESEKIIIVIISAHKSAKDK